MTQHWIRLTSLALAMAAVPTSAPAQTAPPTQPSSDTTRTRVLLPTKAGALKFIDSQPFADSALGTMYRYRGAGGVHADVFIYAVPTQARDQSVADLLRGEAEVFRAALTRGPEEGWFDVYGIAYEGASDVRTRQGVVPSYDMAVVFNQRGVVGISFFAVFVLGERFVKIRYTGPGDESMIEAAGQFINEVAAQLDLTAPVVR